MKSPIVVLLLFISVIFSAQGQYGFNIKRTSGETNHEIYCACYSPDGKYIVTAGSDLNIIIWNAETGTIYRTLAGLKKIPKVVTFSASGDKVASGSDESIVSLWDIKTARIISTFDLKLGSVKALSISPDGKLLVAGGSDRTIKVWDIESMRLIFELKFHKSDINTLKFSPDGAILASGGADKMLVLWNIKDGSIIKSKEAHNGWIRDIVFNNDGTIIASCGDDYLIQFNTVPDLTSVNTLRGHKAWVQSIDFSSDGKYLLSGGHDNFIILWDVASGKILSQSDKQEQIVVSVSYRPDRSEFVSACLRSENFNIWALSGTATSLLENIKADKSGIMANLITKENNEQVTSKVFEGIEGISDKKEISENDQGSKKSTAKNGKKANKVIRLEDLAVMGKSELAEEKAAPVVSPDVPLIEMFTPSVVAGTAFSDQTNIYVIGRVTNAEGTSVILINKKPVKLSEAGVFEYRIDLTKGDNPVDIIAVNNKGKMNEMSLAINCTAETNSTAGPESTPEGKYYALIIGINNYKSSDIPSLDNPIKDAGNLYDVLTTKYVFDKANITFLKNPTLNEIIITLDGLVGKITSNDNLLIFYAGHGYWDDKGKVGYWFPSDATKNSTVNWFRNSTLRDFIGSIQSKHTLLIADACFSGAIFKTRAAFNDAPQGVQQLYDLPSRKAMTSGVLQVVPDESTFMKYLVEKLNSNNEKFLPSELLFSNLKTAVMNNSINVPQYGVIQNVGDEGGDFIFMKR